MVDFRSDTVTQPSDDMRQAMMSAPVGDDVYGDDPTVNRLEAYAAERLGFEAGLFTSSGTQANLLALMSHCQRGDEYLCGQSAHNYKYEAGGAAVLGSIQPQPIENAADGSLPLEKLKAAIKPDDAHFARTRLLSLENTIGGKVLPYDYVSQATAWARQHGLATHLDGARLMNAAVKSGRDPEELARPFDSTSLCLSKGLGAPVGSMLLGSRDYIATARRWRKMLGGGMRQAGILAAAGLYALEHNVERLAEDHANATYLAEQLVASGAFELMEAVQTNIVWAKPVGFAGAELSAYLAKHDILLSPDMILRFVTHLNVDRADIGCLLEVIQSFLAQQGA